MATNKTRIKIRHGSGKPDTGTNGLLSYELGWDGTNSNLFINNNGAIRQINSENAYGIPLVSGDNIDTLDPGIYISGSSTVSATLSGTKPNGDNSGFRLEVIRGYGTNYGAQIAYDSTGSIKIRKNPVNHNPVLNYSDFTGIPWQTIVTSTNIGSYALPITGGTLTGNLTFSGSAGIYYQGTKVSYRMIRFIDNVSDNYGNGISIGGGGQTIIGGGESADTAAAQAGTAGGEIMQVCNDGDVQIISNLQNGWDNRKVLILNTSGYLMCPSYINVPTNNNENPTISQFIVTNGSDNYYRKASAAHAMAAIRSNASGSWGISITGNAAKANGLVDGTSTMTSAYNKAGLAYGDYTWLAGWNGYELRAVAKTQFAQASHTHSYLPLAGGTLTGHLTAPSTSCSWLSGQNAANAAFNIGDATNTGSYWPWMRQTNTSSTKWFSFGTLNTSFYWMGSATSRTENGYDYGMQFNIANGYLQGCSRVYGAVWNDYAEYRKDNPNENQEPGRCIKELGDGSLALTTKRLERGCEIVSDTFGFAIGQDKENGYNTPIASNGRVLAYPYESIEEFTAHIGWPVCSGPNGTVSIMTEEEEEKYPSRIIGTISEIPTYEEWGTGKVKIDGRIWIKVH